jgi:hypothetical protein
LENWPRCHQQLEAGFLRSRPKKRIHLKRRLATLLVLLSFAGPVFAEQWAFTVIGDNRSAYTSYRNVLNEIRTQKVNLQGKFPSFDFVLACGDLDPVEENYKIFREIFRGGKLAYFPVRGNHELPPDVRFIIENILPSFGKSIIRQDEKNLNYYTDWKNSRLIVLDQYSAFERSLDGGMALKWIENALRTPDHIRHVFVAFHEPYLPFDAEIDPFWSLLLRHRDKVKAVFAGHTHVYRKESFPDELTGIYYVNTGNAGLNSHSDKKQTIIEVMIDGDNVTFRVIQAPDGTADFSMTEQWELKTAGGERSQNAVQLPPAFVKVGGSFAVHCVVP